MTKNKANKKKTNTTNNAKKSTPAKKILPDKFPFWGRLKIEKNRTTLVIDEEIATNKKTKKQEDFYVHREATSSTKRKDYEEIKPNPDKDKKEPMYLKRPKRIPKKLIKPHNKDLVMPEELKKRYAKNNKK